MAFPPLFAPVTWVIVFFGVLLSDVICSNGNQATFFESFQSALKYGALIAFIYIRYQSTAKNMQIDAGGFIIKQTPNRLYQASNVSGNDKLINAFGGSSTSDLLQASLKSSWPPSEDLGWTPFKSMPFNQSASKRAQHFWTKGNSSMFNVRSVGYKQSKEKESSKEPLYECIGVDLVRANKLITGISESTPVFKRMLTGEAPGDVPYPWWRYNDSRWSESLGIPRLLIINMQLPYSSPSLWTPQSADSDPGFSIISYYVISPSLSESLSQERSCEPPAVKLLKRLIHEGKSSKDETALKTIGLVENMEEVGFPDIVSGYNGKPVLVTKSCKLSFIPSQEQCEILEIEFDVRLWSILARKSFHSLREKVKDAKCQIGMLIEGKTDDELPEQLLGCFGLRFLDIQEALHIEV